MPKAPNTNEPTTDATAFMATDIIMQPVSTLIPYANNARTHSEAQVKQIAASIQSFGFTNPVLVDGQNGIIAGHGRILAAELIGISEVPTICLPHLTNTAKRAYVLADNRIAINSGWDMETLAVEVQRIIDDGRYEVADLGFDAAEVDEMLESIINGAGGNPPLTDTDDVPELPMTAPKSQRGDIWVCGDHRVMCGDSTDKADVDVLMDGKRAEILFTSPPYSDMRTYDGVSDMSVNNLVQFIPTYAPHCNFQVVNLGIQRKDNEIVEYWQGYIQTAKQAGLKMLAWNVWDKGKAGTIAAQTAMFTMVHEWIFVFGFDAKKINRTVENDMEKYVARHGSKAMHDKTVTISRRQADGTMLSGDTQTYTHHQLHSVLSISPELGPIRAEHPAIYPVALPTEYINAMTDEQQIVVDPFLGSGTTLIACQSTQRLCYGMEISPAYVDVIVNRWQNFTGLSAVNANTGLSFNDTQEASNAL